MCPLPTDVRVRPARDGEAEAVHRVIVSAYGLEPDSERWTSMRKVAQQWQTFLVMEKKGELIATVRVGRDRLRYGESAAILKGEVGYVGVLRELHGQGYGTALMQSAVQYMKKGGFHISRLGGLNRFYARFGYVPFPRRYVDFPLEPIGAGAGRLMPEIFLKPSDEEMARVRPYEPGRDWLQRCDLYDLFNGGRTASMIEGRPASPQAGGPDPTGLRWVYDDAGVRAYAFANLKESLAEIYDTGGDLAHPQAYAAVVKRALWEAVLKGARQAQGRLPHDGRLEAAFVRGGVPYILRELQTAPASNMICTVDLGRFVEAVSPQWTLRLASASVSWKGVLELRVQDQKASLALTPEAVSPAAAHATPDVSLTFAPRAFLLAVLGHRDWGEIARQVEGRVSAALAQTLSVLLRREPCASGPLG